MKTIRKYTLSNTYKVVFLPKGFKILTVQVQKESACVWVMVDKDKKFDIPIEFIIYPTGVNMPKDNINYIGTIQAEKGDIVGHVFYTV
jgi:hypothetical protein